MKVTNNICTIISLYKDDLLIFDLKIHVMNYVKSLFINNIDKKDLDKVEVLKEILLFRRKPAIIYYDPSVRTLEMELEKQNM
jgi:hypothetical protein